MVEEMTFTGSLDEDAERLQELLAEFWGRSGFHTDTLTIEGEWSDSDRVMKESRTNWHIRREIETRVTESDEVYSKD